MQCLFMGICGMNKFTSDVCISVLETCLVCSNPSERL